MLPDEYNLIEAAIALGWLLQHLKHQGHVQINNCSM